MRGSTCSSLGGAPVGLVPMRRSLPSRRSTKTVRERTGMGSKMPREPSICGLKPTLETAPVSEVIEKAELLKMSMDAMGSALLSGR
ncbi:hypothetical protein D3C80_1434120 [compost metagenome]